MEENANNAFLSPLNVLFIHKFWYFQCLKYRVFPILIAKKIHVTVFYLFNVAMNLWHRKFVTADVRAVFVNNQQGIQRRGQDFDKKHINTLRIHDYTRSGIRIGVRKMQFVCIFSISTEYLQKFELLISQSSVATRLRWGGYCRMLFVANFMRFSSSVKILKIG